MTQLGDRLFHALREHPWILAGVVLNMLFVGYVIHEVSAAGERRDTLIAELARNCKQ